MDNASACNLPLPLTQFSIVQIIPVLDVLWMHLRQWLLYCSSSAPCIAHYPTGEGQDVSLPSLHIPLPFCPQVCVLHGGALEVEMPEL